MRDRIAILTPYLPNGIAIEARSSSPFTYRVRVLAPGGKPIGHPRHVTASTAFRAVVAFMEASKMGASSSLASIEEQGEA